MKREGTFAGKLSQLLDEMSGKGGDRPADASESPGAVPTEVVKHLLTARLHACSFFSRAYPLCIHQVAHPLCPCASSRLILPLFFLLPPLVLFFSLCCPSFTITAIIAVPILSLGARRIHTNSTRRFCAVSHRTPLLLVPTSAWQTRLTHTRTHTHTQARTHTHTHARTHTHTHTHTPHSKRVVF